MHASVAIRPPAPGAPTVRPHSHPAELVAHHQLQHDIQHEVATIALLASLLSTADDVGLASRRRAEQIIEEVHWLDLLLEAGSDRSTGRPAGLEPPARLDLIAAEVVTAARLSTTATVLLDATPTVAPVEPLTFRRVLTNLIDNAVRATGTRGTVRVQIMATGVRAMVQIEDDGPGFGAGPAGLGSGGLDITRDLVLSMAGRLQIGDGLLGGCRVRLCLPALPAGPVKGPGA